MHLFYMNDEEIYPYLVIYRAAVGPVPPRVDLVRTTWCQVSPK